MLFSLAGTAQYTKTTQTIKYAKPSILHNGLFGEPERSLVIKFIMNIKHHFGIIHEASCKINESREIARHETRSNKYEECKQGEQNRRITEDGRDSNSSNELKVMNGQISCSLTATAKGYLFNAIDMAAV